MTSIILHRRNLLYFLIIFFIVGFFKISVLGGWDQSFYWAQLTSIWYDGDLTLHDDLLANRNPLRDQHRTITFVNQQGMLPNTFSIGTALFDGIYAGPPVFVYRLLGLPRMSDFFLSVAGIAAIFKTLFLLLALECLLNTYNTEGSTKYLAIAGVFFGTPLLHYSLRDYGMSHLNSGLFATLFVLALVRWFHVPGKIQSVTLGLLAGIMILIRWQNGIYALLALPPLLHVCFHAPRHERRQYLTGATIVVFSVFLTTILQFTAWYKQFGMLFHIPQGSSYIKWSSPQWLPLLLSGYHGLIPWSPVSIPAIIGIVRASLRQRGVWRWFMVGSILTIAATVYVNACVMDWWGGWAYGARRFCCLAPLFALGLFEFLKAINKKLAVLPAIFVILWAHFTLTCYQNRIDDLSVPILGRPSLASPATDDYWRTNTEEARTILKKKLPSFHYSAVRLFPFKKLKFLNRLLSIITILGVFLAARKLFVLWQSRRRFRKILIAFTIGYITALTVIIAVSFPNSYRLNESWKRYLERNISPERAIDDGLPQESVRLLEALSFVSDGQVHQARHVLAPINTREYRNLNLDKILEFSQQ